MPGSKISNAPKNNSFAASLMHLKLRREGKEDPTWRWEKAGRGLHYRVVKIMRVVMAYFKGVLNLDA